MSGLVGEKWEKDKVEISQLQLLLKGGKSKRWEARKRCKDYVGEFGAGGNDMERNPVPAMHHKFQVLGCMIVTQSRHLWDLRISL